MMNKKWSSAYHCHVFEQYTIKKALGEKTIHYDMSIFLYKLRETFQMLIYQAGILKSRNTRMGIVMREMQETRRLGIRILGCVIILAFRWIFRKISANFQEELPFLPEAIN